MGDAVVANDGLGRPPFSCDFIRERFGKEKRDRGDAALQRAKSDVCGRVHAQNALGVFEELQHDAVIGADFHYEVVFFKKSGTHFIGIGRKVLVQAWHVR